MTVTKLEMTHEREMAKLLAESFRFDPAFIALFREVPPRCARSYHAFMSMWARGVFLLGHSVYGVRVNEQLAGVVSVSTGHQRFPASLTLFALLPVVLWGMRLGVGVAMGKAVRRPTSISRSIPEISMLAVSPSLQGRGIASELLRFAHATLEPRDGNRHVYLYTTAVASRKFYEKQGYTLAVATHAAGVDVFHMFLTERVAQPHTRQ